MVNAACVLAKAAVPPWLALASHALPQKPSEPRPRSTGPYAATRRADAAWVEDVSHHAPRQTDEDYEAKPSGPAHLRLLALCILLSGLAAAFATAFATAPHWLPKIASVWWVL
jgi:hypothetical protein